MRFETIHKYHFTSPRSQSVEEEEREGAGSENKPPRPTPPPGTTMSSTELKDMVDRSGKSLKAKSVLVVEDDRESRFMVTAMLSMGEYHVQVAGSRDEAFKYLTENSPDIILLDIFMSGMPLDEFVRAVHARSPITRIILMSAAPQLVDEAARLGVRWFIAKPFRHEALLKLLTNCMQ